MEIGKLKNDTGTSNMTSVFNDNDRYYYDYDFSKFNTYIDWETFLKLSIILEMYVSSIICAFGVASNAINVVIFYRQGLSADSSTVTLAGLSISDFVVCLLTFGHRLMSIPFYHFKYHGMQYRFMFSGVSWGTKRIIYIFAQITCLMTLFLALERAASVVFPYHVKTIFTPRRSTIAITCIYIATMLLYIPQTYQFVLGWRHATDLNISYLSIVDSRLVGDYAVDVMRIFNQVALRTTCVVFVWVLNTLIVLKVFVASRFRKSAQQLPSKSLSSKHTHQKATPTTVSTIENTSTSANAESTTDTHLSINSDALGGNHESNNVRNNGKKANPRNKPDKDKTATKPSSSKEIKLLRLISAVCVMFMICTTPEAVYHFLQKELITIYEFLFRNIMEMLIEILLTINSSCTIFIYLAMSSRFYAEFIKLFSITGGNDKRNTV